MNYAINSSASRAIAQLHQGGIAFLSQAAKDVLQDVDRAKTYLGQHVAELRFYQTDDRSTARNWIYFVLEAAESAIARALVRELLLACPGGLVWLHDGLYARGPSVDLPRAQHARAETPLFTEAEVEVFRSIFADFMEANTARKVDWSIQPFQPYTLRALQQLSEALEDPDTDLFACLQAGAPTGFFKDIPRSGIFVPVQADATATEQPLLLCDENWKGARDNPETLAALVQEELENGWLEEVPLEEARIRWKEIAIGKMNVVLVPDKNPRLTVDATVSGVNQGCVIPERYNLPGLGDLQAGYPLRGRQTEISSFSLDIKAAHKSLLMRERDRGLAGITFQGRTFFYRVMPFGMSCSAYWWQRLSAFFIRTWHLLLFWAHFLSMYVDDLILTMSTGALDISACLLLAFAASFGIRISWPKLQLGSDILWIGWQLCYRAGTVRVPDIKRHKLRSLIRPF